MEKTEKRRGHYLGTEIEERWWRRYTGEGLLARGIGEYWFEGSSLYFLRYLTQEPIVMDLRKALEVKVGKWHSGRWAGGSPVVKIVWRRNDVRLSSGFVLSKHARETEALVERIRSFRS